MSNLFKGNVGIRETFRPDQTCERCTTPLRFSTYEGETLVYSMSQRRTKLYCIRCASRLKRKPTIEQLDNYLLNKIGSISFFMKKVLA